MSSTPMGREDFPVTCVSWDAARAFCAFTGGDLPTESQWEWVGMNAGRDHRSRFTWGGDDDAVPTCARSVWGRGDELAAGQLCIASGFGPLAVDSHVGANGDLTPTLGIAGFGGNAAEWMRDAFATLTTTCWASASVRDPSCFVEGAAEHALRGGSWRDNLAGLIGANRRGWASITSGIGFRCVRPGAP
jgi:formylglycine-generating enzyme required for sulfatase activity